MRNRKHNAVRQLAESGSGAMICPVLEEADARCADHFSLTRLSDAFTHCVGRYQACPVYQRLLHDRAAAIRLESAPPEPATTGRIAG